MSTRLGLIRCEHCGRQFNAHSGARHIPWCAKQQNELRKHKLSAEKQQALERYKWRINYKPSNQIFNKQQQQQQSRRLSLNKFGANTTKKSSINSSATLSSPSASSSTSIGTSNGSILNGENRRHSQGPGRNQQQQISHRRTRQPSISQLKRSVSSLTLTKQVGVLGVIKQQNKSIYSNHLQEFAGVSATSIMPQSQIRAKSVSDLNGMGEMVEILARRMDEIYEQNQTLLANFSRKRRNDQQDDANHERSCSGNDDVSEIGNDLVKCHHCKSNCLEEANYCHKCGCKLRVSSSSSPA